MMLYRPMSEAEGFIVNVLYPVEFERLKNEGMEEYPHTDQDVNDTGLHAVGY